MNLQGWFESGGQLNTCLINLAHILSSPHDRSMGLWAAVLQLQVAAEGGREHGPDRSGNKSCEGTRMVEQQR